MVVLSTRYNLLHGHSSGWNREDKHAGGGVVWGWVTDRKVWPRLKFNQRLSVISVKNILIEILESRIIQRFKKIEEKIWTFFAKIINYADGATSRAKPSA
jgi:altronate dehydratase